MKKTILIFYLIISGIVFGQKTDNSLVKRNDFSKETNQYCSYLNGFTKWSYLHDAIDTGIYSLVIAAYGDTVINGVTYKKIYYEQDVYSTTDWKDRPDLTYPSRGPFIRENENASKLYIYDIYDKKEYLISDMDLKVGDVFPTPFFTYSPSGNIIVEAVYYKNGLKHIVFNNERIMIGKSGKLIFIEGIGPNIFFLDSFFGENELYCFQSNSLTYKSDEENLSMYECGHALTLSAGSLQNENMSVYINEEKIVTIDMPFDREFEIRIYNSSGLLMLHQKFKAGKITIPLEKYSKGVYLVRITDRHTRKTVVKKIIR